MNFIERPDAKATTTILTQRIPNVLITTLAMQKMFTYTDECPQEIGWLGTAYRDGNVFTIDDVFLFKQEVSAVTTEITPEGLEEFATELLAEENGMEIWNNMKVWGHSHVNMAISPSSQDDKQMQEFQGVGHDWFIRLICNKKGELAVDVYDYEAGLVFKNVPWERVLSEEEEAYLHQTIELRKQLEEAIKQIQEAMQEVAERGIDEQKVAIKAEMAEKVLKKTYTSTYQRPATTLTTYTPKKFVNAIGRYVGNDWKTWAEKPPTLAEVLADASATIPERHITLEVKEQIADVDECKRFTILHDEEDVYKYFDTAELDYLSYCNNIYELRSDTKDYGYENQFSKSDLQMILKVAHQVGAEKFMNEYNYGYGTDSYGLPLTFK